MEKMKILGGRFAIQPIYSKIEPNWQCCLAGSSKTTPSMLIFSTTMGADYSFELIFIETHVPQFIGHINFSLASMSIYVK
jgi:hypothetical protein